MLIGQDGDVFWIGKKDDGSKFIQILNEECSEIETIYLEGEVTEVFTEAFSPWLVRIDQKNRALVVVGDGYEGCSSLLVYLLE